MYAEIDISTTIKLDGNCLQRVQEDPNEEDYCYDDEDK